jgi:cytochrome c-type biogenesis protein CcmH
MKLKILLARMILFALLGFVSVGPALAQAEPTDNQVNEIAKKLYCPVCPNTPLDVCETKACEDWRAQIKDELRAGWTEDQIIEYFVVQYGERVLAEPRRSGFTSMVWVLPMIGAVFGLAVVGMVVRGWNQGREQPITQDEQLETTLTPEVKEWIEKKLLEEE